MYGHIYRMTGAVAEVVLQVPELTLGEILVKCGAKKARQAFERIPLAKPDDQADGDANIFGIPDRFGNMCV